MLEQIVRCGNVMEDLWEASVQGNLVGIRRAINLHGVKKLNGFDRKGITPLFLATSENKLDAVELLVTSGADVNLRSKVLFIGLEINLVCIWKFTRQILLGGIHTFNGCCL